MDTKVMQILNSGKGLDRYKKILQFLNNEDCGEYEEQPRKKMICCGCIKKNKSMLIIA